MAYVTYFLHFLLLKEERKLDHIIVIKGLITRIKIQGERKRPSNWRSRCSSWTVWTPLVLLPPPGLDEGRLLTLSLSVRKPLLIPCARTRGLLPESSLPYPVVSSALARNAAGKQEQSHHLTNDTSNVRRLQSARYDYFSESSKAIPCISYRSYSRSESAKSFSWTLYSCWGLSCFPFPCFDFKPDSLKVTVVFT